MYRLIVIIVLILSYGISACNDTHECRTSSTVVKDTPTYTMEGVYSKICNCGGTYMIGYTYTGDWGIMKSNTMITTLEPRRVYLDMGRVLALAHSTPYINWYALKYTVLIHRISYMKCLTCSKVFIDRDHGIDLLRE